jgi:hypothetical protein
LLTLFVNGLLISSKFIICVDRNISNSCIRARVWRL